MKTHDEFIQQCYNNFDDMCDYRFITEYSGLKEKVTFIHLICGNIHSTLAGNFLKNHRCKICGYKRISSKKIKSQETFEKEIYEKTNREYKILGKYIGNKYKILVKHITCGNIFESIPCGLLRGEGCPVCGHIKASISKTKSNENFIKELFEKYGNEYIPQKEYSGAKVSIPFIHSRCGNIVNISPDNILNGKASCRYCSIENRRGVSIRVTSEYNFSAKYPDIAKEWDFENNKKDPKKYSPHSGYKVYWICSKCGNKYISTIHNRTSNNRGCPGCASTSRGEMRIKEILDAKIKSNIIVKYDSQYSFSDCRDINTLRYDFAIWIKNDFYLCEYMGIQHYEPIDFAGRGKDWANKEFLSLQRRDNIKAEYCKSSFIKFIVIPYWEYDNIEAILKNIWDKGGDKWKS